MTSENWEKLRNLLNDEAEAVKKTARRQFDTDRRKVRDHISNGNRGAALRLIHEMKDKYNGIPDLMRETKALGNKI